MSYAEVRSDFGKISTALEENTQRIHREAAIKEIEEEYPKYFEVLGQHPRQLVGMEVPSMVDDKMIILRDSSDAKDWQEMVTQVLRNEASDRASRLADEDRGTLEVLHGSIELFQNNTDLVPGTREFDRELADQFTRLAKPYEVRVEGKLRGYSVPVQPLIEQIRTQLVERRQATPPPAAPAPAAKGASEARRGPGRPPKAQASPAPTTPDDGPQAGIPSKAGASGEEAEDYSVLFGTLGLPTLRI